MERTCVLIVLLMVMPHVDGGTASFTGVVVDADNNDPVAHAEVCAYFENRSTKFFESGTTDRYKGFTDVNGLVHYSATTTKGEVGWRVLNAKGYYSGIGDAPKYNRDSLLSVVRWLPWNQVVTARLDRIISPIPLFVKTVEGGWFNQMKWENFGADKSPNTNTVVAVYDLIKGDWLPPYGNGEHEDIRFTAYTKWLGEETISRRHQAMRYRTDYCIEFPGNGNGTCEVIPRNHATLKLRVAPTNGYVGVVTKWDGWFGVDEQYQSNIDTSRCFAFRIRTRKDKESEKIEEAYYGKVYGDWNFLSPSIHGGRIIYYLNLTPNDRNLEWDMKTNLCPNPGDIGNPQP